MIQCRGGARDASRQRAVDRQPGHDLAIVIEVHVPMCRQRRLLAPVDHDLESVPGAVQQPETAAADARTGRFHDGQRRTDGHRSIERIAAGREYFQPGLRSQRVRACHRVHAGALRHERRTCQQQKQKDPETGSCSQLHAKATVHSAVLPVSWWYFSFSWSSVSVLAGSTRMHSTGQTSTHCDTSK